MRRSKRNRFSPSGGRGAGDRSAVKPGRKPRRLFGFLSYFDPSRARPVHGPFGKFARLGLLASVGVVLVLAAFSMVSEWREDRSAERLAAPRVSTDAPAFNGNEAFAYLKKLVGFGPRPAGSKALEQARAWIFRQLKESTPQVEEDSFTAETPLGRIPMTNLIAKFPGARPQVVMIAGHYDTMRYEGGRFVGANDGGSSAALLLELARELAHRKRALTYWVVFFDGEEALVHWSDADSLYGSRHLAAKLAPSGVLNRVKAMILVDMIGDAKLDIFRDESSTPWLRDLVFATAHRLGYTKYFEGAQTAIGDDHIPFVNAGISAVDLIDLDYGPSNSYWHTPKDTLDKCSPNSLTVVGRVVLASLDELENAPQVK